MEHHAGRRLSALTQRVELTIVDPREDARSQGTGWAFDYAYEKNGRWYGGEDWIKKKYWSPELGLTACIDPDRPADHVVTLRDQACGQERIAGNFIVEGETRPAP